MKTARPIRQFPLIKQLSYVALTILTLGASMNVFGFLGFGNSIKWKQEVLLHDSRKIIVERSQSYGGSHEIGQTPPIKEQDIVFTVPGSSQRVTWNSEYSKEVGAADFAPLALHFLKSTAYIVANPIGYRGYQKWGKPNPPYIVFKFDGKAWQRIPLTELPIEFKEFNLVIATKNEEKEITKHPLVSAELVKRLNSELRQPEYKTILREPLARPPYQTGARTLADVIKQQNSEAGTPAKDDAYRR